MQTWILSNNPFDANMMPDNFHEFLLDGFVFENILPF
jgi:hypothetical protein